MSELSFFRHNLSEITTNDYDQVADLMVGQMPMGSIARFDIPVATASVEAWHEFQQVIASHMSVERDLGLFFETRQNKPILVYKDTAEEIGRLAALRNIIISMGSTVRSTRGGWGTIDLSRFTKREIDIVFEMNRGVSQGLNE